MWVVATDGRRGNKTLFLIDRSQCKNKWWSEEVCLAMKFNKLSAAEIQASKIRYNNPRVIHLNEAKEIADDQFNPDDLEHPYSTDALGQN